MGCCPSKQAVDIESSDIQSNRNVNQQALPVEGNNGNEKAGQSKILPDHEPHNLSSSQDPVDKEDKTGEIKQTSPTHNIQEQDKLSDPAPEGEKAVPHASQASGPRSELKRTALEGLKMTLNLAEKALDGAPIPGVKGTIGAVLKIIEDAEKVGANTETLLQLQSHVDSLCTVVLKPLSGVPESDVPITLKSAADGFVKELEVLLEEWSPRASYGKFRRFLNASSDEGDLKRLSEGIRLAVERFQVEGNVQGQFSHHRIEKDLDIVKDQMTVVISQGQAALVDTLPRARQASFDSGRTGGPTTCFQGTRINVLKTLEAWIGSDDEHQPRVYWLNGLAGVGKSTIAKTISEFAHKKHWLGGSFFFSRGDQDLSNFSLVFPTLAFQLAQFDSRFKLAIAKALEGNADLGYKTPAVQVEQLLVRPLVSSGVSKKQVVLLVLDALDECREAHKALEILQFFLAIANVIPFLFRILITSRPEHHIQTAFDQRKDHSQFILHNVEESVVQDDIRRYLRAHLVDIPKQLGVSYDYEWPREEDLEGLVRKSGTLFVYAATAIRFIANPKVADPQRWLDIQLEVRQAKRVHPFAELDGLYLHVLQSALPADECEDEDFDRFSWIVGCLVLLRNPLSMRALALFTEISIASIRTSLRHVQSVIICPPVESDEGPHIYHPSFPDFITNPARCTDSAFIVEVPATETRVVLRCFAIMEATLRRDVAELGDESPLNDEILDFEAKVARALPEEVRYACLYWAAHLVKLTDGGQEIAQKLNHFVSCSLLNWIEAMSLLNAIPLAVASLRQVKDWAVQSKMHESTNVLLYDGYRLLLSCQFQITRGALQVYRTGLPFTPHGTMLYKTYEKETTSSFRVMHGNTDTWSPCLGVLHGGFGGICSVAYSMDGYYFATGNNGGEVVIWEAESGSQITNFKHSDEGKVRSIAFADHGHGRLLTSGEDGLIILWDLLSRTPLITFRGHIGAINAIAARPQHSPIFASASSDSTIRLWNVTQSSCINELHGDGGPVNSIAFVSDRDQIVSGSQDGVIRLWDIQSSVVLKVFPGNSSAVRSLAVSPNGQYIASGSDDHTVKLFDVSHPGDNAIETLLGHTEAIETVCFSPDGRNLVSGGYERYMRIWDVSSRQLLKKFRGFVTQIVYSPDGSRMASSSTDSTCRLWDAHALPPVPDVDDHQAWVISLKFSPDGELFATGSDQNERLVKIWDAHTGRVTQTLRGHRWAIYCLGFSADGTRLASGSGDCSVRVWDVGSGELLAVLSDHDNWIKEVEFTDGGQTLISRTEDDTFHWDLANPKEPVTVTKERNDKSTNSMMSGYSKGFRFSMGEWHWVYMGKGNSLRRAGGVLEEYRITGFGFHSDRAVFACTDGSVVVLDVSQLKKEFNDQ
ncbi:hypothetical protein CVT24_004508 [Panaeolus cyanescens]|uniref:NACHT domain-containing protein n=1 Tax=Panaeolus cyanescens TaxID=181874 RepID=A0A409YBQ6_9AGAR|nr:hypothetical protein CVT24_004508 [Panaeolus cyanescens]